jgi:hypothetical protein
MGKPIYTEKFSKEMPKLNFPMVSDMRIKNYKIFLLFLYYSLQVSPKSSKPRPLPINQMEDTNGEP